MSCLRRMVQQSPPGSPSNSNMTLITSDSFAKVHRSPAEKLSGRRCPARGQMLLLVLFRRCDPARDLRPRPEAKLVEDAADVAVDGTLRDEQPGADLLVAQAVRDQARDVGLSPREHSEAGAVTPQRCDGVRFAQRQPDRALPAQPFAGAELRVVLRPS